MDDDAAQLQPEKKSAGVVYLSSVPAYMTPVAVESFLKVYGEIGRVFLRPESEERYRTRVRHGGRDVRCYKDGWVEFLNKRNAKRCAEMCNGQTIGGKNKQWAGAHWDMKYLHRFKWTDLTGFRFMKDLREKQQLVSEIQERNRRTQEYFERVVVHKEAKKARLRAQTRRINKAIKERGVSSEKEEVKGPR